MNENPEAKWKKGSLYYVRSYATYLKNNKRIFLRYRNYQLLSSIDIIYPLTFRKKGEKSCKNCRTVFFFPPVKGEEYTAVYLFYTKSPFECNILGWRWCARTLFSWVRSREKKRRQVFLKNIARGVVREEKEWKEKKKNGNSVTREIYPSSNRCPAGRINVKLCFKARKAFLFVVASAYNLLRAYTLPILNGVWCII